MNIDLGVWELVGIGFVVIMVLVAILLSWKLRKKVKAKEAEVYLRKGGQDPK